MRHEKLDFAQQLQEALLSELQGKLDVTIVDGSDDPHLPKACVPYGDCISIEPQQWGKGLADTLTSIMKHWGRDSITLFGPNFVRIREVGTSKHEGQSRYLVTCEFVDPHRSMLP